MSAVERVEYMDNQRTGIMTETYAKERKIQRDFFAKQEAQGKCIGKPPTPATKAKTALDIVGVPEYVQTARMDPEQAVRVTMSKNMWICNPGYLVRDGPRLASSFKQDFVYDEEEVEYMRSLGYLGNKKHNRQRDEFVMYVEAAAKQKDLSKRT